MKPVLLNFATSTILIFLLSGCSCDRTPQIEVEEVITTPLPEIPIIDPLMDDEIVKISHHHILDQTPTPAKPRSKRSVISKSMPNDQNISHQTYPISSYSDLEFINLDSGIKYQILSEGPANNETPKCGQTVVTHYTAWHNQNGKPGIFIDSSYERDNPFEFKIGQGNVIPGWDIALMDMKVGDKRRLFIPSEMAYGKFGAATVPGDTDLIYEVEVIEIK